MAVSLISEEFRAATAKGQVAMKAAIKDELGQGRARHRVGDPSNPGDFGEIELRRIYYSCVNEMVEPCLLTDLNNPDHTVVHTGTCYMSLRTDLLAVMHVAAWLLVTASTVMVHFLIFFSCKKNVYISATTGRIPPNLLAKVLSDHISDLTEIPWSPTEKCAHQVSALPYNFKSSGFDPYQLVWPLL